MSQAKTVATGVKQNYVVAIGASAGGLEAIHEFFDNMPANSSFAFIVIQHLSSDYKSLLVELVSKHTHMKVFEAGDNMLVQQDCVYIIPNNKLMTIRNGRLKLEDKIHDKMPNTAIDTFLYTLAQDKKDKAIAIILSGTGTDGTKGIEAIKDYGGLVMVQEPATAKFDGMPNSAITSGNADFILPTKKMHQELYNYIQQEPMQLLEGGKINENLLNELFGLVHQQSGHDFNFYKTPTIIRRIGRRMNQLNIKVLDDYVSYLHTHHEEVKTLGKEFLIGVTKFFRDKAAFQILSEKVIPAIVDSKADGDILKVWVCACSTGEEAYSIAILINECLEEKGKNLEVKIFASDIDETSLEVASRNLYPLSIEQDIDEQRLDKYFVKEGRYYSVLSTIRKQIVFAKHNVIKAPPFIKNDLITCRNMLIYMNNLLQQKVLSTLHFSLNQEGYLFLGSSESASVLKDGLIEINAKWKVYQKSGNISYSANHTHFNSPSIAPASSRQLTYNKNGLGAKSLEDEFRDFVTDDLGIVGIFINSNYEVKETVGNFNRYLSLPEKKLDLNLLKMVPRELSFNLNNAIRRAWKEGKTVRLNHIRYKQNGVDENNVGISIKPPGAKSSNGYTLITFRENVVDTVEHDKDSVVLPPATDGQQTDYVIELESELNETRHNLQLAIEEMETTNEELQSSNEELLSANEELQSGNEELQSLNEELHTLNTEHQLKIKELIELNDDLNNYFKSTEIGQIFLDANLHIRKFNPAAVSMVNLIEADISRPISHISHNIKHDTFIQDISAVLVNGNVVEKEVHLKDGKRSLMRIMPFVRRDKQHDGIVITFVDISAITELNNIVNGVFNASISAVLAFTAVRDNDSHIRDFKCIAANNAAVEFLNTKETQLTESLLTRQLQVLTEHNFFDKFVKVVETGQTLQEEVSFEKGWYLIFAVKMADGFAVTYTNITERRNAEQKLRKNYNELISTRENLKKLNNELEDKVRERTRLLSESEERFTLVSKATNDTIWDWNLVNNTMWRSENFTAMFGYHRNEDTQSITYWFDKIHPDDRSRVEQSVYESINLGKKQWSAEYRFLKADNRYAIILDRGSILQDDFGTPYRMVGSIVDITRLVEAERRLSNSELRFRKVFESNMIGMLFSSLEGAIIDANDAFLKMLGYKRADLMNGKLNWKIITPPEFMDVTNWSVEQLRENGVCPPFEKQYIKKDGSRVSVLMGAARLDDDSTADVVAYIIDVTHQKDAEQKEQQLQSLVNKQQEEFYSVFMNAPALITICRSENLTYEFVNKAFQNFYGQQDYLGKTAANVYPDFANSKLHDIAMQVMKSGEPYVGKAFHTRRTDQVSQQLIDNWFDFIYTPVYAVDGKIDGLAFFGFDVTDLIKAQQATKQLMQRKDEFMSIASHELKTPITSLKGSLQIATRLVAKDGNMQSIYPFIEKAGKQTGRLTALVDDLLDVTRIHAGKMMFNYSWFNAGEVFRECIEDTQSHIPTHKIIIKGDAEAHIHADKHRLEQVITNLITNAIKYSPDADQVIFTNEVKDGMLKVSVQDFGIGIPADKKDFVFDRFFRVQESSHKFSGLGLGLYITSEIIRRHEGVIGVESAENKGSTFWFYIPVHEKKDNNFISN
ncbi:PAS domain S-box protein [Mucilaginibacter sp. Bleaf8]|uniref:chemotaxis protein CheB n=1 Tax=Mucilaginibacter sp. Bleaf8 TaxID=2834430 RepID=UPI001BCB58E0|nr:chemotaxis protein CheB [Mucilaginibacter sp. Bleaf8]MBS7565452.1 PAS domain S-box protein [Mucilaginibacter sp. Bleaf8]